MPPKRVHQSINLKKVGDGSSSSSSSSSSSNSSSNSNSNSNINSTNSSSINIISQLEDKIKQLEKENEEHKKTIKKTNDAKATL
jgi:hypothetical protein